MTGRRAEKYALTENLVQVDGISTFAMRTDVDTSVGLVWLDDELHQSDLHLRPIIKPFSVTARQQWYVPVLKPVSNRPTADGLPIIFREVSHVADKTTIDIPEILFTLDQDQFAVASDIVRNVFLAPPYKSQGEQAHSESSPPLPSYFISFMTIMPTEFTCAFAFALIEPRVVHLLR